MSTIIHQAHDKLFKQSMSDLRVAREFFTTHLPDNLRQILDLKTLRLQKHSFIDQAYKATQADVVYKVKSGKRSAYLYLLCEKQSKVDRRMAFRLLSYMVRIMSMHQKQHPKEEGLPLVYPMVVYVGEKPWNAPRDIYELFGEQEGLAREILFQPFQLIDVQRIEDEELRKHLWSGLVEYVLKHRKLRDLAKFLEELLPWLDKIDSYRGTDYGKIILKYVGNNVESNRTDIFIEKAEKYLTGKLKGEAMTLAEAFKREGMQRGIEQDRRIIAIRLLKEDLPLEQVLRITELSKEEVEQIRLEC